MNCTYNYALLKNEKINRKVVHLIVRKVHEKAVFRICGTKNNLRTQYSAGRLVWCRKSSALSNGGSNPAMGSK
jgi:hypothetical protein